MQHSGNWDQLIIGTVLCALLIAGLGWLFDKLKAMIARSPVEPIDDNTEVEWALAILARPRRVAGNQYMNWRCIAQPCDAPRQPNNILVHDPSDPNHNPRTCAFCNERPHFSGASSRPIN